VNIGSDEMVSMNEMAEIVLSFENKSIPIQHIPGPEGVRGRNSDNTLIKEKLGWAPTMKLKVLMLLIRCKLPCFCFIQFIYGSDF
jgi:GDP-D-mannose 3',5'-epimerase